MKSKVLACTVIGLALLASGAAYAQSDASAPTATGETGLFTIINGETVPQGDWSFGLYINNWDRVFEFDEDSDIDWSRLSASLGYGITDRFELSLMVPYDDFDADFGPAIDPIGGAFDDSGIGNARLGGKFRLGEINENSASAINFYAELPTGDEEVLGGEAGFGAGYSWNNANWTFHVGYRAPGEPDGISDLSDEVIGGLGWNTAVSGNLDWITELVATYPLDSDEAIFEESVDLTTGGRLWLGTEETWAFNFGLRTDLLQLSDTDEHCPIGGLIGLTYFPRGGAAARLVAEREAAEAERLRMEEERRLAEQRRQEEEARRRAEEEERRRLAEEEEARRRAAEATPPPPAPAPEERVTVQFGSGSARLSNIAKAKLDEVALKLKQDPDLDALVIGYSDNQGGESANQRMSERRAEAVEAYLVSRHGIDEARIDVEGRGSAEPVGDNATSAGRAENRRAVIVLSVE